MATFRVGDRARVVSKPPRPVMVEYPSIIGWECVVTGERPPCGRWPEGGYLIAPVGGGYFPGPERQAWVLACQLEPIQPTPTAQDICEMEGLPEWNCPLPVEVRA